MSNGRNLDILASAMGSAAPSPRPGPVLTKAAIRAAEILGLKRKELAEVLGLSESTLSRLVRRGEIRPATKTGELALLFVRVFRGLDALVGGDREKARAWLRAENEHLGGVPRELLGDVVGLVHVLDYLDAMRGRG